MIRIHKLVFLILVIVTCTKTPQTVVEWAPHKPVSGQSIEIIYHSTFHEASLVGASAITLFCEFYTDDFDSVYISDMVKSKNGWHIKITPPQNTHLISFKFEDNFDLTDDNIGRGWNILINNENGSPRKNAFHKLGQIYAAKNRLEALPDFKKAIANLNEEVHHYPTNYRVWLEKWEVEYAQSNMTKGIEQQLDSLIQNGVENDELSILNFYTNIKLLGQREKAIAIGEKLLNENKLAKNRDQLQYNLIFLKYYDNPDKLINELENFIDQFPKSKLLESAYMRLGNLYLRIKEHRNAKNAFEKAYFVKSTDVSILLILISMEIEDKNYNRANELLKIAELHSTSTQLRQDNPWSHPIRRKTQLNYNQCQIYSTKANLNDSENNFEEAITNRKKVIELGTPFPAYEWVGIGNAYLKLKDPNLAQQAFIKALILNSDNDVAVDKLRELYVSNHGSESGFDEYLEKCIIDEQQKSAQVAHDFHAVDINDNKVKLSDMKGKVIVLYFWDSWSNPCKQEIPQLNELVADFESNNFVEFWAISSEHKTTIQSFLKKQSFMYRQFYQGSEIKNIYNIIAYPTHFVIDSNGMTRYSYIGFTPHIKNRLKEDILFLFKENNIIL